jgi:hypothetical protein
MKLGGPFLCNITTGKYYFQLSPPNLAPFLIQSSSSLRSIQWFVRSQLGVNISCKHIFFLFVDASCLCLTSWMEWTLIDQHVATKSQK